MAKADSTDFLFEIDVADSGALSSGFTAYLTRIGDIEVSKGTVSSTPLGADTATYMLGVFKDYPAFTIEGWYDDTADTGPDAILNIGRVTHAVTRSFSITFASGKTVTGECWITNYKRTEAVGEYCGFSATLQPTGTITEA